LFIHDGSIFTDWALLSFMMKAKMTSDILHESAGWLMNLLAKIGSKIFSASAVLVVVLVIGCGGDELGKRYAVYGSITYKGKPLPKGTIAFVSDKPDGRGASGVIQDGKYQLTTQVENDGAFPGTYLVTINDIVIDASIAEAETKKLAAKKNVQMAPGGMVDQAQQGKALRKAANNVPAKYASASTSGLKAEVKASSNKFDFELTD